MARIEDFLGGKREPAPERPKEDGGLKVLRGDKLVLQGVEWVWQPYIPNKMVTLVTGDPEAGKGWITADVGAALTAGRPLPGQKAAPPARVLYLSAEDNPEHVLGPRLILQGADMSRIRIIPSVFNITSEWGLGQVQNAIRVETPRLVFIDPITSFFGDKDPNKITIVNALFGELAKLAADTGVAIVAIRHRRKPMDGDRKGRDPKFGGVGSIGFTGSARSELLVGMTPEGQRAMAQMKCSVGPHGPTIPFSLDAETGRLEWGEPTDEIDDFDLSGKGPKKGKGRTGRPPKEMEEACSFLRSALAGGQRMAAEVYGEAVKAGLSKKTVSQAKGQLGVRAWNEGGVWWLEMPHA